MSEEQYSNTSNIDGNLVDGVRLYADVKYNDLGEYMSSESDSDDGSRITEEEERLYAAAVKASDGFDVPVLPGVLACCVIKPCLGHWFEDLNTYCVAGMKHYNQDKANYKYGRGITYYVSFKGRTPENNTKIFEAQVLRGVAGDDELIKVELCREKAPPPTKTGNAEGSGSIGNLERSKL